MTLDKLDRPAAATGHLPIAERVLDRMADIMLASDEILEMLAAEPGSGDRHAVESAVRRVYDEINEVMKTLTD